LDNHVHIAHNVKIGNNCIIAGQVGIAGSTTLGDNVIIGGQAGVSGHLKLETMCKLVVAVVLLKILQITLE